MRKLFSIITPTAGTRPRALAQCVRSVAEAADRAELPSGAIEHLIGFDGVPARLQDPSPFTRAMRLPPDNDWGNGIRNILLRAASGDRIIFLDDDNILQPIAFAVYMEHPDAEMVVARADTQRAFDQPFLPVIEPGEAPEDIIRQCNIDPLCLCLSRELVVTRCGGWNHPGKYEADFLNIRHYHRRARSVVFIDDVVGVYDYGRNLDRAALSRRQENLLDRLRRERSAPVVRLDDHRGKAVAL